MAEQDFEKGHTEPNTSEEGSTAQGRSQLKTMQKEPKSTTSHKTLSEHAKTASRKRNEAS